MINSAPSLCVKLVISPFEDIYIFTHDYVLSETVPFVSNPGIDKFLSLGGPFTGFSSFSVCSLVLVGRFCLASLRKSPSPTMSIPWQILYVCIMSPRVLLPCKDVSPSQDSRSSYCTCESSGTSCVTLQQHTPEVTDLSYSNLTHLKNAGADPSVSDALISGTHCLMQLLIFISSCNKHFGYAH